MPIYFPKRTPEPKHTVTPLVRVPVLLFIILWLAGSLSAQNTEYRKISLWDGSWCYLPSAYSSVEFPRGSNPAYLIAFSRERQARIAVLQIKESDYSTSFIENVISKILQVEQILVEGPKSFVFEVPEDGQKIRFRANTRIREDKMFILLTPEPVYEECLAEFQGIQSPSSQSDHAKEPSFSVWQLILSVLIFLAFVLFIFKALKDYSKLTHSQ